MAFPAGWGKKHKLTIDHTKVSGSSNLTNFPVYLSGDNFLADVFTKAAARREINANWLLNDANLQGYWRLESDGTDSSSNGYNLTNSGASFVAGKFGNGADLELTKSDYLYIADASCPNLEISGSQTWSAWVKAESAVPSGRYAIMSKRNTSNNGNWLRIGDSQLFQFGLTGLNTNVNSSVTMSADTWYHLVGVYNSSTSKLSIWVNGVKSGEISVTGSPADTNANFAIGCEFSGAGDTAAQFFDGIIDDVAIFNRALSDYEIKALYYGTADLRFSSDEAGSTELASEVVFFDPDNSLAEVHVKVPTVSYNTDTDFYVWYEASTEAPYAPNATYGSQAVWSDLKYVAHMHGSSADSTGARTTTDTDISYSTSYGKSGQGALLTRSSPSKIALSNLGISGTTAITISGWIYTTDNDSQRFYNQGVWNSSTSFGFYKHSAPGLGVGCGPDREVGCLVAIDNNTWHHIACVYPGSGSMMNIKFYLNGVEQTTQSWSGGSGGDPNMADSNYNFGHLYTAGGSQYFDGRIDSVRVGNVARSADWIATEYANQSSPGTFVTESEARTPNHGFINHQNPGIV